MPLPAKTLPTASPKPPIKKRTKQQSNSQFLKIKGVGEKTIQLLFKNLKSVKGIREAALDDLVKLIGKSKAFAVLSYIKSIK